MSNRYEDIEKDILAYDLGQFEYLKLKKNMKKLIDIPEEIVIPLKVKAAKQNKDLKNYIQDLLIEKAKQ